MIIDLNGFLTISLEEAGKEDGSDAYPNARCVDTNPAIRTSWSRCTRLQECLMLQTERDDYAPGTSLHRQKNVLSNWWAKMERDCAAFFC